ncbi:MAG TPA: GxxExxY protein [Sphingomonadaceae bacterium]|nr:GxxExxY protein [Sphingomonadaceae bacterium]
MPRDDELERIASIVVDCGFQLHKDIGPGLLESVYEILLSASLEEQGLQVRRQVPVSISHKGVVVDNAFKMDLLVEERLVLELKSTEVHAPVHAKQLTT